MKDVKNKAIPRSEHPRPQFLRESWQNLNGEWEFEIDAVGSGKDKQFQNREKFDAVITVPFCPESKLSGIGNTDFMQAVWYAREIEVTAAQLDGTVLLHFGAADYHTTLFIGGKEIGRHMGGYAAFTFDITPHLTKGKNRLVVLCEDDIRSYRQPRGKQSALYYSHGCDYTRTTGIWQTVWLEFLPKTYLKSVKIDATDLSGCVQFTAETNKYETGLTLKAQAFLDGKNVAEEQFTLDGIVNSKNLTVNQVKLWNPGAPVLYDVVFTLYSNGKAVDTVKSYFGIRRIDIDGYKVLINGKSVFQRLVLDQGFYPDGIYTAPDDETLKNDIILSMNLGFNGARLHQKVFEERFLYHADTLGYLVWGEHASWGIDITKESTLHTFTHEWLEIVKRDYNHPSIIGWCPYNETWDYNGSRQLNTNISIVYQLTKALDRTRPVIDTSGNYHTKNTDIYDVHDYCQDVATYAERYKKHNDGEFFNTFPDRQKYDGVSPYFVSEYGGIKWAKEQETNNWQVSWGYGDAPKSADEFVERYCGLTEILLDTGNIMGFCYTQLTDVEQEQNGMYYYDRSPKFPKPLYDKIAASNKKKAAIEK